MAYYRKVVRFFDYEITTNKEVFKVRETKRLNYKSYILSLVKKGYTNINIKFLGTFTFEE